MAERAHYKKLDFVSYFKAFTEIRDEWIEQFISRPKCLAALEAFTSDRAILGRVLFALADELSDFHGSVHRKIVLQAARRHDLPRDDPRHIDVSDEIKKKYFEFFPNLSVKGNMQDFWHMERRPAGWISVHGGTEKLWSTIRHEEEIQYVDYWKIANREEYDSLLSNRALLAKIDAFNRKQDDMEPWDHSVDIENFAGSDLQSLELSLRSIVLAHLSRDIRFGIIEIPADIQKSFQRIYADRGIV